MKYALLMLKQELFLGIFRRGYFIQIMSVSFLIFFINIMQQNLATSFGVILILSQIITASISSSYIFQDDYQDTSLEQMLISGHSRMYFIVSKIGAYWFAMLFSSLINLAMIFLIHKSTIQAFVYISAVLAVNALVLSSLSGFIGALTLKIRKATLVQFLISIPLTISLVLYSTSMIDHIFLTDVSNYGLFTTDLKILVGIALLLLPITFCACGYLISII